eukprot:CAMPEP_0184867442 /NCGR_PEP_ID=MMETSP0580-20130426/26568_1 /TAXON_ID=1118495 /ORGANISM="Dactyliosolen fragilissimus" /LENGTH=298 /DNA_ID=CAMNT_0027367737 /DNA_START=334 /DNA_END=1230 /DNA_ORIENTATION=+
MENLEKGRNTLWANIGAQQFHLPEGKPDAQVLDGEIRLCFDKDSMQKLKQCYKQNQNVQNTLKGSHFDLVEETSGVFRVIDPWGSKFKIISSDKQKDIRGLQGGKTSLGTCMDNLTIHTYSNANIAGIARFYEQILDAPVLELSCDEKSGGGKCVVSMGPYQTLAFQSKQEHEVKDTDGLNMHVDLRDEPESNLSNQKYYPSNYGPHISLYIRDIRGTFRRAEAMGVTYVNPRFKRRAYNEEEVVEDCMFRCLDIVDPENLEAGTILRLEHEVRSVLRKDGSMYKSCPFENIPPGCII